VGEAFLIVTRHDRARGAVNGAVENDVIRASCAAARAAPPLPTSPTGHDTPKP
jgi:hypothetical protein